MAPRITVALWILLGRILSINISIFVGRVDVVVDGVGHFTSCNAARKVPDEAIIVRICLNRRIVLARAATQESQLFIKQSRDLVIKAEELRSCRAIRSDGRGRIGRRAKTNRWVKRVRIRIVAKNRVHIRQTFSREQKLLIDIHVINTCSRAGCNRHRFGLIEKRLIKLNEADRSQIILIERNIARVRRTRRLEHCRGCLRGIFVKVGHALRVRRYIIDDALNPTFSQSRATPIAPRIAHRLFRGTLHSTIPHHVIRIDKIRKCITLRAKREARTPNHIARSRINSRISVCIIFRHLPRCGRLRLLPFKFVIIRHPRKRFRIQNRQLLRKQIDRIFTRHDAPRVILIRDGKYMHRYRVTFTYAKLPHATSNRRIILNNRHISRIAHRCKRIVISRNVS